MRVIKLAILLIIVTFSTLVPAESTLNIPLTTSNGNISLNSLKGKYIYLDFWAAWCGPCRKSFPWMNRMLEKYSADGLTILAVNVDEKNTLTTTFLNETPAKFTIAYDPQGKLASALKLKAMPSSFLIDPEGNIIQTHAGFKSQHTQKYENSLRKLLGLALLTE